MVDESEAEISWREVAVDTPVMARDGTEVGRVVEVAALESEDIFHGIVFKTGRLSRQHYLAPAADIERITPRAVHLSADSARAEAYDEFQPLHIERVGLRGIFGWKHYGWRKDSEE
jgi:uncharacterized protein YrrD